MTVETATERGEPEPTQHKGKPGTRQFIKLPVDILQRTDLAASDKLVFGVILDRIGDNAEAWPGLRRIASACGIGVTAVRIAVGRLEAEGLIAVERAAGNPSGRTNRYRVKGCAHVRTCQKAHVAQSAQPVCARAHSARSAKRTDSDPSIQTQVFRPKGSPAADSWESACSAMTTNALRTDGFRAAWDRWWQYRREARKPLTPSTAKAQVRRLEGFGNDDAIQAIDTSIGNGWAGLFPPDGNRTRTRGGSGGGRGNGKGDDPDAKYRNLR